MFDFLQSLPPAGETCISDTCTRAALGASRKGLLIILSDFLDPAGFEEGLRALVSRNLDVHVVHILSPEEVKPSVTGDLKIIDCETGAFTEVTMSAKLRGLYEANLKAFLGSLKSFCTRRGVNYIFARTDAPFEKTVLDLMRRGGILG
jgi:hypothetical protein